MQRGRMAKKYQAKGRFLQGFGNRYKFAMVLDNSPTHQDKQQWLWSGAERSTPVSPLQDQVTAAVHV